MTKDEAKHQNNDTHIQQHRRSTFMQGYQSACMEVGTRPTEFARRNPFHCLTNDEQIDWAKGKYERLGRQYDDLGWVDFYQGFLTGMYDCVGTVCEADQVERTLLQKAWEARQNESRPAREYREAVERADEFALTLAIGAAQDGTILR